MADTDNTDDVDTVIIVEDPAEQIKRKGSKPNATFLRSTNMVADWDNYLEDINAIGWVCPVDFFAHAPFASIWHTFAKVGMKIEIAHPQSIGEYPVNCIATIIGYAGYKALLKFERAIPGSHLFSWMSFCSDVPKPMGYSLRHEILVHPVYGEDIGKHEQDSAVLQRHNDPFWNKKYLRTYYGAGVNYHQNTVAINHGQIVKHELMRHQGSYQFNQIVELLDKENPFQNRLAKIINIIGDRITLHYIADEGSDQHEIENSLTVSMKSEFVHSVGWSDAIGQTICNYPKRITPKLSNREIPRYSTMDGKPIQIGQGMVFELRHPFQPYKIVSGYVDQKLKFGHFVASIETNCSNDRLQFVFHLSSDYILPCGFSKMHNLEWNVPLGEDSETFSWESYCQKKGVAPLQLEKRVPKPHHQFTKGGKLEAAGGLSQSTYYGPATISDVAGHLLYLNFDGWPKNSKHSTWVSALSPDIYPAGWAEMVGHHYQSHPEVPDYQELYSILSK